MKVEYIPRALADKFSDFFAGKQKGFSAREISDYFIKYSSLVKHIDFYGIKPTRIELFIESLYSLEPKQQYYALNDLTFFEYPSKYDYPSESARIKLREELHTFISPNPIGLGYSKIRETAFRSDWIDAYRKIHINPAEAITAARTLLETTLKTILHERGVTPKSKGDLSKLVKEVEQSLGFKSSSNESKHQIFMGFSSIINGISALSNKAGDRHGTVGGIAINDPAIAELCVNTCGTLGLMFIEVHLFKEK